MFDFLKSRVRSFIGSSIPQSDLRTAPQTKITQRQLCHYYL
jgi:hypothetical protein